MRRALTMTLLAQLPLLALATLASPAPAAPAPAQPAPAPVAAPAPRSTPDARARFLAGLEVAPGDPLEPLERTPAWRVHVARMEHAWARLSERLDVMSGWAARELRPRIRAGRPLLYLFGGPDVTNPLALYPDAPVYVLAGLEPVGAVPPPEALTPKAVAEGLDALHEALRSVVPAAFFRTIEMGHDLRGHEVSGVWPLAYLFLARSGATIQAAEKIELDPFGFAVPVADEAPKRDRLQGLRVAFTLPGRGPQVLYYLQADLGNDALAGTPAFVRFVERLGPTNAMFKAASFILHDNRFSRARDLLLASAESILQDDSGVPARFLPKKEWELVPFGVYLVPKRPFTRNWQPELDKLFKERKPPPVPFTYGYRHGAVETNLVLAVRAKGR